MLPNIGNYYYQQALMPSLSYPQPIVPSFGYQTVVPQLGLQAGLQYPNIYSSYAYRQLGAVPSFGCQTVLPQSYGCGIPYTNGYASPMMLNGGRSMAGVALLGMLMNAFGNRTQRIQRTQVVQQQDRQLQVYLNQFAQNAAEQPCNLENLLSSGRGSIINTPNGPMLAIQVPDQNNNNSGEKSLSPQSSRSSGNSTTTTTTKTVETSGGSSESKKELITVKSKQEAAKSDEAGKCKDEPEDKCKDTEDKKPEKEKCAEEETKAKPRELSHEEKLSRGLIPSGMAGIQDVIEFGKEPLSDYDKTKIKRDDSQFNFLTAYRAKMESKESKQAIKDIEEIKKKSKKERTSEDVAKLIEAKQKLASDPSLKGLEEESKKAQNDFDTQETILSGRVDALTEKISQEIKNVDKKKAKKLAKEILRTKPDITDEDAFIVAKQLKKSIKMDTYKKAEKAVENVVQE